MSLNKRNGLYAMPSHHLHGAKPAPRPTFNSMDFAADEAELPNAHGGPIQPVEDGNSVNTPQEKEDKKKKRKQSMSAQDVQQTNSRTPAASTPLIKVTPATASTKGKKEKKSQEENAIQPDKKRKCESEGHVDTPPSLRKPPSRGGFVVGADMLRNVQSSIKAAGEVFGNSRATAQPTEEPSTKKTKKDKTSRKSNDTVDFDRIAKETRSINKKAKKEKKAKRKSTGDLQPRPPTAVPVPVPSPRIFSSPPRKTPVPLPVNAFSRAVNASKVDRVGRRDSRLLVLETPPSQLPKTPATLPDSPIPFKLTDATKTKGSKKSKKVVDLSPPMPFVDEAPSSAPPVLKKNHRLELKPDGRVSLTTSNLIRYTTTTQPLSDKPRSKPLSRAASVAASTAGSTTSGGTTPSIKELFARVGKPYSRSGAEIDPFVVPEAKKKVIRESHEEANTKEFNERCRVVQKAVNFSDEREYLSSALSWRNDNDARGPLPCLGIKASGCNTKREQVLRLSREDPSNLLKVLVTTEANQAALEDAKQRAAAAESFLAMAVAARVPVPIGKLEGVWKLFCPAYSDTHVDKYGYGQRTLSIFSIAGFKDTHSYTARLSIPPRSMLYSILSFSVPPHASFRSTTVKTSAEGYKMDIVFLGNGYLLLRVDVSLLLSGKEMQTNEGKSVAMEFVGVHQSAVVWREREDELEVVGKRLFAKYDGEA
ncbi:hypothetical protein BU25DRAFT_249172 [Macroventuria anomochaeta]|uniref:Uncharacterized protein n=1 Tax=Macroventuria anomochaeta TaxID=301207 RepID=A0ACB6S9V6_9PLEO|nr:uncharacterized protein BU25DRAFT_249172 [Macroventuria anomochaeta]KAF2630844.1 hypothetical protein BU25DRAFT_249172 [Macroventuria anomochaeta]